MSTGLSQDSQRFQWIPRLIKAHALVDGGTRLALRQETALRGQEAASSPACRQEKSCGTACHQRNVSVTAVELAGAVWHLDRNATAEVRRDVLFRLAEPSGQNDRPVLGVEGITGSCPFSLQGACTVYPLRFMACRQLRVANDPGQSGSRSDQHVGPARTAGVLTPLRQFTLRAFSLLLPFYGIIGTLHDPLYLEALLRELSSPVNTWSVPDPAGLMLDVEHARLRSRTLAA